MVKPRVAIVGAGVSGLAAAWQLRNAPVEVAVFDKSRGVSGRAASRTRNGARFDFGANYFKLEDPELAQLVLHTLSGKGLVSIEKEVWTFDADGRISPGDPVQNRQTRWTYSSGISTLGKQLAAASGVDVKPATRISSLQCSQDGWMLQAEGPATACETAFDAVLLTPPAPQVRDILAASELGEIDGGDLDRALSCALYHQQLCFALAFSAPLEHQHACFALINIDRGHDIAWLSFENDKPGRELGGCSVIMVQMSPDWSRRHFDNPPDRLVAEVSRAALSLLDLPDRGVDWFDCQRWRFAHPYEPADAAGLALGEEAGLFFAGDALVGKGRVGEAMVTGLRAADLIISRLA